MTPLATAARERWDVLVVGAGPAGALAAYLAAREGARVLLVDKASFPRAKVCGSCLNAAALAILDDAGLASAVAGTPRLDHLELAARGARATLRLPPGRVVSRHAFDATLVRHAVAAGAHFLPATTVTPADTRPDARRVSLRASRRVVEAETRVVLAADGLAGRFHPRRPGTPAYASGSRIGLGALLDGDALDLPAGRVRMACGRGGYVGLVRLEDDTLDVAAAVDPRLVRRHGGPGPTAMAILTEAGLPTSPALLTTRWHGTPPLTRDGSAPAGTRLLVIGDAAGYVEPFTGEGIAWALASARAAAPVAVAAAREDHWSLDIETVWATTLRELLATRRRRCRRIAGVLRHPRLTALLIRAMRHAPSLATPVVRRVCGPIRGSRGLKRATSAPGPDVGQPTRPTLACAEP